METGSSHQPRKHSRHKPANTFIVNKQGVCRVFDLSRGGLCFGCTSDTEIPDTWTVDIIDNAGTHLPDLSLRTVWTTKNHDLNSASIYEIIVGAAFNEDLSPEEQSAFDHLFADS